MSLGAMPNEALSHFSLNIVLFLGLISAIEDIIFKLSGIALTMLQNIDSDPLQVRKILFVTCLKWCIESVHVALHINHSFFLYN